MLERSKDPSCLKCRTDEEMLPEKALCYKFSPISAGIWPSESLHEKSMEVKTVKILAKPGVIARWTSNLAVKLVRSKNKNTHGGYILQLTWKARFCGESSKPLARSPILIRSFEERRPRRVSSKEEDTHWRAPSNYR
ncbi:hypothetical protein SDJN03_30253, partial [Cucurbita argyrosperma subsp. sororia]